MATIILIEDGAMVRIALERKIQKTFPEHIFIMPDNEEGILEALNNPEALVLCDFNLDDLSIKKRGPDLLREAKFSGKVIVISGEANVRDLFTETDYSHIEFPESPNVAKDWTRINSLLKKNLSENNEARREVELPGSSKK